MRFLDSRSGITWRGRLSAARWFSRDKRQPATRKFETAVTAAGARDKSSPPKLAENGCACVHGQHVLFGTTPVSAAYAPERDYVTKQAIAALLDMNQDGPSATGPPGAIRHRWTGDEQVEHKQAAWP
jgi:hypothetical protein